MAATTSNRNWTRSAIAAGLSAALAMQATSGVLAQARAARRGASVKTDEGGAAVSKRGAAVKTDEGAGGCHPARHGREDGGGVSTVNRGYRAPAARGGVAVGDEAAVAVGPRGAVVVGEEGAAARGRYSYRGGVAVYEDNDAWKTAAGIAVGVAGGIAIGTLLAKPPKEAAPVTVSSTTYLYENGTFYTKAMHEGQGRLRGGRTAAGGHHPDAACRMHVQRGHFAVRNDPLQEGGVGLRGRRTEVKPGTMRERSWAALPAVVLAVVAATQIVMTEVQMLSPWKGGGFGMFSTLDERPFRYVRMFVRAPERSEELAVPPSLEEPGGLRRDPAERSSARAAGPCSRRARAPARPARRRVRIDVWRVEFAAGLAGPARSPAAPVRVPCGSVAGSPPPDQRVP
jgi:hypothetical protein